MSDVQCQNFDSSINSTIQKNTLQYTVINYCIISYVSAEPNAKFCQGAMTYEPCKQDALSGVPQSYRFTYPNIENSTINVIHNNI